MVTADTAFRDGGRVGGTPHPGDFSTALARLDALETESAVRRLMAILLEAGDANDADRVAGLFTADGVWEGVGAMAAALGTHIGAAAIGQRYRAGVHPMSFAMHFLTNETITVDGDSANGTWRFLQAATVQGQALWIGGQFRTRFTWVAGEWKIAHLQVDARFATPYEQGWARQPFISQEPSAKHTGNAP